MTETTKTLKLTFLNSKNKKTNLSVANPLENLDEQSVRKAMDVISGANIFEKEEVDMYKTPQSAQYVERVVTDVFNDAEDKQD